MLSGQNARRVADEPANQKPSGYIREKTPEMSFPVRLLASGQRTGIEVPGIIRPGAEKRLFAATQGTPLKGEIAPTSLLAGSVHAACAKPVGRTKEANALRTTCKSSARGPARLQHRTPAASPK